MKRRLFLRALAAVASAAGAGATVATGRSVRWSRARTAPGLARRILRPPAAASLRPARWAG